MVAARFPMPAIALNPQVENRFGSWSLPTVRIANAVSLVWPELMTPRSSSFSPRNESASSMRSVGAYFSIVRNTEAGEILAAVRRVFYQQFAGAAA
jgi:hypothetical protein